VDRALVESAQHGDEDAFAALMSMNGDRLTAIAYRILRDVGQAEDAVQEAIVAAWRDLPDLRDPDRFPGWLYRVLVHACYAQARHTRRWNAGVRVLTSEPSDPSSGLRSVDDRDQLDRAFRRLPPEQRAIVVMHHYPRLGPGRGRGDARHPAGHGQVPIALRNGGPASRRRGRLAHDIRPDF